MTELQKLSLKKLRKTEMPLFVLDKKSKNGGFAIVDLGQFEDELNFTGPKPIMNQEPAKIENYRFMGLLWDRPELSNSDFHKRLKEESHGEHQWALKRLMEYCPSPIVTRLLSLKELQAAVLIVSLRPYFKKAWKNAIHHWSKKP